MKRFWLVAFLISGLWHPLYSQIVNTGDTLEIYYDIVGPYRLVTTGGTFRTEPNDIDASAITDTSRATITIPDGAYIKKAFLMWAASNNSVDDNVTLDGVSVTADKTHLASFVYLGDTYTYYGAIADVTDLVRATGTGTHTYTLTDMDIDNGPPWSDKQDVLGGWSLVVVYNQDISDTIRKIVLWEGFHILRYDSTHYTLRGFWEGNPPKGRMLTILWEGDPGTTFGGSSEYLNFNDSRVADTSYDSYCNVLDTTLYGVDVDTFDVHNYLSPGDSTATMTVSVGQDMVILQMVGVFDLNPVSISGYVYEDPNGDGDLSDKEPVGNATINLFDNSGNYLRSTTTDDVGFYYFENTPDDDYYVTFDSRTVEPNEGFNSGFDVGDVWAEETHVSVGSNGDSYSESYCDSDGDPSTAPSTVTSPGVCFGGKYGNRSDSASALSTAEHVIKVHVENYYTSTFNNIAFSFNTVTNTNDQDDDGSADRTCQGCFRQFIQNANAVSGANHMRFVPIVPTNSSNGSGNWWTVTAFNTLPRILDIGTTVDGTAFCGWTDGTNGCTSLSAVRDENPGQVGSGGTVGMDSLPLPTYERKEFELNLNDKGYLTVQSTGTDTFMNIAVFNGTGAFYLLNMADGLIENVFMGPRADGSDPGGSLRLNRGVEFGSASGTIRRCYIGYTWSNGLSSGNSGTNFKVYESEIFMCALGTSAADGMDVIGTWQIVGNLFHHNGYDGSEPERGGAGVELGRPVGIAHNSIIENNTSFRNANTGINILDSVETCVIRKNIVYENGYGYDTGEPGTGVKLTMPDANKGIQGIQITQNSIYDNEGLSIDVVTDYTILPSGAPDGVTANDGVLYNPDEQPNLGMDYPIFTQVRRYGYVLHVEGIVGTESDTIAGTYTIEIYKADNDGNNNGEIVSGDGKSVPHGEGRWYIGSCTTNSDGTFSCDVSIPTSLPLASGDSITATATDANGNTSEFSADYMVEIPISGLVFEDVDGEGEGYSSADGDEGKSGVLVRLYKDSNDDGVLDSGDEFVDDTTTNGTGLFVVYAKESGKRYFVVVNSKDVTPKGGYNADYGPDTVWAEQTCEEEYIGGALVPHTEFGGEDPTVSDSFSLTSTDVDSSHYEHVAMVEVDSEAVSKVYFGFNFNVVVNTLDEDQDGSAERWGQGQLRQFILNANGIAGSNHMRFVPMVATNSSGSGGNWWTVTISEALPIITDDSTSIDGTAYDATGGVRDENPGQVGSGGTVGVDQIPFPQFERKEFEINANDILADVLNVDGDVSDVRIANVAIYNAPKSAIELESGSGINHIVEHCFVGFRADGTVPISDERNEYYGIRQKSPSAPVDSGKFHLIVRYNYVGYNGYSGILGTLDYSQVLAEYNEVVGNGWNSSSHDGIDIDGIYSVIRYNLSHDQTTNGTYDGGGSNFEVGSRDAGALPAKTLIENNTSYNSALAGLMLRKGAVEVTVRKNIFRNNYIGVYVNTEGRTTDKNKLTMNEIYDNQGLGIDLGNESSSLPSGDGVTANDGVTTTAFGNDAMDYPIFTQVRRYGSTLHVEGFVGTETDTIAGTHTIEIYKADNDGNNNGEIVSGDGESVPHGEGRWYIGSCTSNSDGTFSCDVSIPSSVALAYGDSITATATDANGNTSEFSADYMVEIPISGLVFEDVDGEGEGYSSADGDEGKSGVLVRLYKDSNGNGVLDSGDEFVEDTTTNGTGLFVVYVKESGKRYFVVVNSKDVTPKGGYNADYGPDTVWAEQTCEEEYIGGALVPHTEFGGEDPTVSDSFSLTSTDVDSSHYEHVAMVEVDSEAVSKVYFGFNFNVVVNTLDEDQDGGAERWGQGQLRQFILNANGISGGNHMRFVPMVSANQSSSSGSWWQITISSNLPDIIDDSTVIDGTAYDTTGSVRNDNSGQIGTGGTVGVGPDGVPGTGDEPSLPLFDRLELEINGDGHNYIFTLGDGTNEPRYAAVRRVAIYNAARNAITIEGGSDSFLVEENLIGVRADGSEPASSERIGWQGIKIRDNDLPVEGGVIQNNYIAFCGRYNVSLGLSFTSGSEPLKTVVRHNEIVDAGKNSSYDYPDAISVYADSITIEENLIRDVYMGNGTNPRTAGKGLEIRYGSEYITVRNNTIYNTQSAGVYFEDASDSGEVSFNIIHDAGTVYETGGIVISNYSGSPNYVRISKNSIYQNNGLGIDLVMDSTAQDGVTPNDGTTNSQESNDGMDYPVIVKATITGNSLSIQGYVGTNTDTLAGRHTIEVFKADNDGDNNGEIEEGDGESVPHGEGRWYIGTCYTATDGSFDCTMTIPSAVSLSSGDSITATATDEDGNTSEFGANAVVGWQIRGTVFEDVDGEAEGFSLPDGDVRESGVLVRLYLDANGNNTLDSGDQFMDSTRTNFPGAYNFTVPYKDTTYFVVVNSKDITPKGGYNTNYGPDTVWAEQTYEREYLSGSLSPHPEYGGEDPTVSDSFSLTSTDVDSNRYEHVAKVELGDTSISGIDFGFNFNVVVNTLDEDQDGGAERWGQGQLRQFMLNSNGISGANHMRFVPMVATNSSGSGGNWWTVTVSNALPTIIDQGTTVDGTAYCGWTDGTNGCNATTDVRDENPGEVGTGGTVGIDSLPLPKYSRKELEINLVDNNLAISSTSYDTIRNIAIYNAKIAIYAVTVDSLLISNVIIGPRADGSDPGGADRVTIGIGLADVSGTVDSSYIGYTTNNGFSCGNSNTDFKVFRSEVFMCAQLGTASDGMDVVGKWEIRGNLFHHNGYDGSEPERGGSGVELGRPAGNTYNSIVENNTIYRNANSGINILDMVVNSVLRKNIIYENGYGYNTGQPGVGIKLTMPDANKTIENIEITQNSIYDNEGLSIDIVTDYTISPAGSPDGVTPNDGTLYNADEQPNHGMDYPIFAHVQKYGDTLHVEGFVGTQSDTIAGVHTIEVFKVDNDGNNDGEIEAGDGLSVPHGEGRWYIGSCETDSDGTFSCDITIPSNISIVYGDSVAGTATDSNGNTSEFSANYMVEIPIIGVVFEDVDGEGEAFDSGDGDEGKSGVLVRLYKDSNDDDSLDSGDEFVYSDTTDSNGRYILFANESNKRYFVVVNSKDITPKGGYNTNYGPDTVWAEQTYEKEYISGAFDGHKAFGGENPTVSDNFSLTSTDVDSNRYEHVARVDFETNSVEGIDFGFNFNVVVNTLDEDQDTASARFAQGSFRQFILNANGITGPNQMRFVPMVPTNASGGGGDWWSITLASTLPTVTDDSTIVDGTAYDTTGSVRDDNPGQIGTGGTVGVGPDGIPETNDEDSLPLFDKPELEINGSNTYRLSLGGTYSAVRKIAFYRSAILLQGNYTVAEDNLVGMRPDGSTPLATSRWYGIQIYTNVNNALVRHNYVKVNNSGIRKDSWSTTSGDVIEFNEVDVPSSGQTNTFDGILFIISGTLQNDTVRYNLVKNQQGAAMEIGWSGGTVTGIQIYENSFIHNGYNGASPSTENIGVVVRNTASGSNVHFSHNIFAGNGGSALTIQNTSSGVSATQNCFYNNLGISIDFDADANDPNNYSAGDGVTPNDGTTSSSQANNGMDYPVFTRAYLVGITLHVEGYVGTHTDTIAGTHTIEIYKADNDGNNNGEIEAGDGLSVPHGEGHWYVGTCTTNADGSFSCDITLPSAGYLVPGDSITATATDANGNTSEFGANFPVGTLLTVSGYVYEDANHNATRENGENGISGVRVELWYWNGSSWAEENSTNTAADGSYSFSPANYGTYRVIEDYNNNAGSDPDNGSDPDGYVSTSPNVVEISWNGIAIEAVNFGDFHGARFSGTVFYDAICGFSGATNNNAQFDAGEAPIADVSVFAATSSGEVIDGAETDESGNYTLWIPDSTATPFYLIEHNPDGYTSTGDHDGQAGASNPYSADTVEIASFISGTEYSGYDFGDVRSTLLEPNHSGTGVPGAPITYSHLLVSGTELDVDLSFTSSRGWNWVLIHDVNENGVLDGGDTLLPTSFTVEPCETLYLIVRAFIPTNEPLGSMDITTVNGSFVFVNNSSFSESSEVVDLTNVSGPLKLTKSVDKSRAQPGELLTYTIGFKNIGVQNIENITVTDPIDNAVEFEHNAFGANQDVEFHYPDGTIVYLVAELGGDTNNDGAWLMQVGGSLFLRIDFDNLDDSSPGPITQLLPNESGTIVYKVRIK